MLWLKASDGSVHGVCFMLLGLEGERTLCQLEDEAKAVHIRVCGKAAESMRQKGFRNDAFSRIQPCDLLPKARYYLIKFPKPFKIALLRQLYVSTEII